jgi:predicted nucleic acid-binding protein
VAAYFDSSVLISLVVGDAHAARAQSLWQSESERVSSTLIEVECTLVLRRAISGAAGDHRNGPQLIARLTQAIEEVTLKPLDPDIVSVVRDTPALAGCRALDAAHLATALYFRSADPDLYVCTFDGRMAEVAKRLGFAVQS